MLIPPEKDAARPSTERRATFSQRGYDYDGSILIPTVERIIGRQIALFLVMSSCNNQGHPVQQGKNYRSR